MRPYYVFPLAGLLLMLFGCASDYSLREKVIRSGIPKAYSTHTGGIVVEPTDGQVQEAIGLGLSAKEKPDLLQYAYLAKASQGSLASDVIYVSVFTPLHLISQHALEQARAYRPVDSDYVTFARGLRAVKLAVSQQYISAATWQAYAFKRELVLLRDGMRVEPLAEVRAWHGENPFRTVSMNTPMEAAINAAMEAAAKYSGMGSKESSGEASVTLSSSDAVFASEEITKPGNYEIVFREPNSGLLGGVTTKEIRIPISFAPFR